MQHFSPRKVMPMEDSMALSTNARRSELKNYAEKVLGDESTTKAQDFVNILYLSTGLVKDVGNPANAMIEDLTAVLVGDDRIPAWPDEYLENRGQGPYYAGTYAGSTGFKSQFQEDALHNSYQVQHSMAGIGISYRYSSDIEQYVLNQEDYPPDRALYEATFKIGNSLSNANYHDLPKMVTDAIGDGTIFVPLPDIFIA
jgi:hypothetical protein